MAKERNYIALTLRHGEIPANDAEEPIFRGRMDEDLDSDGVKEAHKAAKMLKEYKIKRIVCSPLKRTLETARIVAEELGLDEPEQESALFPFDTGFLTGESKEEFADVYQFFMDNPDKAIPRGESVVQEHDRVKEYFKKALKTKEMVLYVCHSSVMVCLHNLLNVGELELYPGTDELTDPGGICGIYEAGDGYGIEAIYDGGASIRHGS